MTVASLWPTARVAVARRTLPCVGRGDPVPALRRLRIERGLTQAQLAERAGLNRNTVLRLESTPGKGADVDTLQKLADALSISIRELLAAD